MKLTTIYLTPEMEQLKKEIESSLDGAKLTHQAVYRRGLTDYKNLIDMKKGNINLP